MRVPAGTGHESDEGAGGSERNSFTRRVWHGERGARSLGQNGSTRGGGPVSTVSVEVEVNDEVEADDEVAVAQPEDLLVEEVSIDGLCGVY